MMNQEKIFRVDTTGDEVRNVELRIIDASEPFLTYKEMQSVEDCCEIGMIQIPTGNIVVASTGELGEKSEGYCIRTVSYCCWKL